MKVLFVAHSGETGCGANRSLLTLMAALRQRYGVEPCLLVPGEGTPLSRRCAELNIPVYAGKYHTCCTVFRRTPKDMLRAAKLLLAPALDALEARRLNSLLPGGFDLYYTNDRMACVGAYLARLRGRPHVWHVRSFSREMRTFFPLRWYRRMDRYADRIVLVSRALYEDFARHIPPDKLRTVYNGLKLSLYALDERKAHRGFRLLLAGRITPAKGIEDAVRALDILVNRYGADAYLSIAGQTPAYEGQGYARRLHALAARLGLQNRVRFLGEVSDLRPVRAETDAELVCSWKEPFGRTTVEAMMTGLPVVGTDAGGTAEIIRNGETGLLYPPRDYAALAEKLKWLWEHPGKAMEMGRAGKERAIAYFTDRLLADRVMEVLHELC